MSMKETSLPFRFSVRQRSLTRPREKVALPAPMTLMRTCPGMGILLRKEKIHHREHRDHGEG
jgi:hypothetical protein